MQGVIRVGIGGWTFAPWRRLFYPADLRQKDELSYAASKLTAIEINGTYYSTFKPATFAKWAAETPEGFVFAVKASRFCTNRKVLAEGGEAVRRFFAQGVGELGDRLGPILWQFMPTKKFDPDDFAGFLDLLPEMLGQRPLRHVVEVRHDSFRDARFVELCRERSIAICVADHGTYPLIADVTADIVYVRLMRGSEDVPTCYPPAGIEAWARRLKAWADGGAPDDLPRLARVRGHRTREVFAFFISGGKPRAPAGAMAMIAELKSGA
ncbi:MAG: DUF72 domain-containing protein [Caulobacteraceae bacterium]